MSIEDALAHHDLQGALQESAKLLPSSGAAALLRHAKILRLAENFAAPKPFIDQARAADPAGADLEEAEWWVARGYYGRADALAARHRETETGARVLVYGLRFRERHHAALALVDQALVRHPESVALQAERGAILSTRGFAQRNAAEGWTILTQVLQRDPFNQTAMFALAANFGDRAAEVEPLLAALLAKTRPGDFLVQSAIALFLTRTGKPEQALDAVELAVKDHDRSQWPWLRGIEALQKCGETELADAAAELAAQTVPESARVLRRYATRAVELGHLDRAEAAVRKLESEERDMFELKQLELDIARRKGDFTAARTLAATYRPFAADSASLGRSVIDAFMCVREFANAREVACESGEQTALLWNYRIIIDIAEGEYEAALKTATEAEAAFPDEPEILALKAWLLANDDRYEESERVIAQAIERSPASSYPEIVQSEILLFRGEIDAATRLAEGLLNLHPDRLDLRHTVAECAIRQKKPERAVEVLDEALRLDRSDTVAAQMKAIAQYKVPDVDAAFVTLEEALARFTDSPGLRGCRGYLRLKEDDVRGATDDFHWSRENARAAVMAKTGLGAIAQRRRDLHYARFYYAEALEAQPAAVEAMMNLAWSYAAGNTVREWNEAEQLCTRASVHHPRDARVLGVRGVVAWKRGERRKALRLLEASSAAAKDDVDLIVNYGATLRRAGRLEESEKELTTAVDAHPEHARARIELAAVLLKLGKTDDARKHAQQAADRNPGSAAAARILAAIRFSASDTAGAELQLRRALAECDASELLEVRLELARLLLTTGDASAAEARLREALDHIAAVVGEQPQHGDALLLLAWAELKRQRPGAALRALAAITDSRLQGYVTSLRNAAKEQQSRLSVTVNPRLQWVLAAAMMVQIIILWVTHLSNPSIIGGTAFAALLPLLIVLLMLTFLLPRITQLKLGSQLEASMTLPPQEIRFDALVTPMAEFDLQPALEPLIGPLAYDT
ncbi:MAG TPA: tetratricopeptide repeat protein [Thermoanaerobaculia bacterium]